MKSSPKISNEDFTSSEKVGGSPSSLVKLSIVLLGGLILVAFFIIPFLMLYMSDTYIRSIMTRRQSWINEHKKPLLYVFTDIFPEAEKCKNSACEKEIRKLIDVYLGQTLTPDDSGMGRLPIFFVKLKDGKTLEKLYQGGGYKEEKVDTKGERMVVQMLEGERNPFAWPQYHCCGGDDIIPEIPLFSFFLPPRVYLGDFYTEIEHIFIMKDESGKTAGALVYLYGD